MVLCGLSYINGVGGIVEGIVEDIAAVCFLFTVLFPEFDKWCSIDASCVHQNLECWRPKQKTHQTVYSSRLLAPKNPSLPIILIVLEASQPYLIPTTFLTRGHETKTSPTYVSKITIFTHFHNFSNQWLYEFNFQYTHVKRKTEFNGVKYTKKLYIGRLVHILIFRLIADYWYENLRKI